MSEKSRQMLLRSDLDSANGCTRRVAIAGNEGES
jgi:hypothetical protein